MTEITHLNTELINSLHDKFTSELQNGTLERNRYTPNLGPQSSTTSRTHERT